MCGSTHLASRISTFTQDNCWNLESTIFTAAGYREYSRQHRPQAIAYFNRALKLRPDDGPSKTMLARCRIYLKDPPPEDRECVFEPKTK